MRKIAFKIWLSLSLAIFLLPRIEIFAGEKDQFQFALGFLDKYREYLQQPHNDSLADILRKTKEYGFKYTVGNDEIFKKLKGDADYSISFENGKYTVSWSENGKKILECQFPANIGMMTFSDKTDLEKKMSSMLSGLPSEKQESLLFEMPLKSLRPISFSDLYVLDSGYFFTPRLKSMTVFQKSQKNPEIGELLIDFSDMYLLETVRNIMLTGYSPKPIGVNVKLSEYGYKSSDYNVSLPGLVETFAEEGSIPYWGVDSFDGKVINGVYVWKNEPGGFNHVLTVKVPVETIKNGGKIDANLYCYVRMDNLKALFEEFM